MADPARAGKKRPAGTAQSTDRQRDEAETLQPDDQPGEPSAERGERHETGKAIARGGKTHGHVPGAQSDRG